MSAPVTNQPQPPQGYDAGAGYPPVGYAQPGYPPPQGGYPPPGPPGQPGYGPPGYPQPPFGQPGYPQPGYPPPGYPQPGYTPGFQAAPADQANWMPVPQSIPNCPPGLEYLTQVDQLLVHQKVELLEAFTGFETNNKYSVKNSMGQKVYHAVEDTDCCTRNCCGPLRPFDLKILDNSQREVIHLYRPFRCDSCWYPCCLQELEVMAPPGNVIGFVKQEWSICIPKYTIRNASGDTVLRIEGPFCTYGMCGDVEFSVFSRDGTTEVGKIVKQWSGLAREAFTDADHFGISFPMDLDVNIKAVLLGACFLIDFMFFEKSGNKENDTIGMT